WRVEELAVFGAEAGMGRRGEQPVPAGATPAALGLRCAAGRVRLGLLAAEPAREPARLPGCNLCGRARGARLLGCGWFRLVLRRGSGAPGFRCGRSAAAAEESNSTAHGAADPAEKPRTTPLAGLGRKLGGEGCGCH